MTAAKTTAASKRTGEVDPDWGFTRRNLLCALENVLKVDSLLGVADVKLAWRKLLLPGFQLRYTPNSLRSTQPRLHKNSPPYGANLSTYTYAPPRGDRSVRRWLRLTGGAQRQTFIFVTSFCSSRLLQHRRSIESPSHHVMMISPVPRPGRGRGFQFGCLLIRAAASDGPPRR